MAEAPLQGRGGAADSRGSASQCREGWQGSCVEFSNHDLSHFSDGGKTTGKLSGWSRKHQIKTVYSKYTLYKHAAPGEP